VETREILLTQGYVKVITASTRAITRAQAIGILTTTIPTLNDNDLSNLMEYLGDVGSCGGAPEFSNFIVNDEQARLEETERGKTGTREIVLTKGRVALVSAEDYEWLSKYKWYAANNGYAQRSILLDGKYTSVLMHREIMNTPKGVQIDHVNGDRADNRRENLREVTCSQNQCNKGYMKDSTVKFKGVALHISGKFNANICFQGKKIFLGSFSSPEEAARAYDQAAVEMHGQYGRLNFGAISDVK
jgi:hypothetical protein